MVADAGVSCLSHVAGNTGYEFNHVMPSAAPDFQLFPPLRILEIMVLLCPFGWAVRCCQYFLLLMV